MKNKCKESIYTFNFFFTILKVFCNLSTEVTKWLKVPFILPFFFQCSKFLTDKSVQVKRNWRCALFLLKFTFFLPIFNFFFHKHSCVFLQIKHLRMKSLTRTFRLVKTHKNVFVDFLLKVLKLENLVFSSLYFTDQCAPDCVIYPCFGGMGVQKCPVFL